MKRILPRRGLLTLLLGGALHGQFAAAANVPPALLQPFPALTLPAGTSAAPIPLTNYLRDPDVPGSAVRITVRIGNTQSGVIDIALHDATAPLTVANFKNYISSGRYAANFFHRSVPGFIIQNGGFRVISNTTFGSVPAYPAVLNEPGTSNIRGTLAMAKLGNNPNSATNQWFINLANNSANLDVQNGGFTVFAHVLGNGMAVADAIAAVPRYNASGTHPAWSEIPLTAAPLIRANFIETDAALISPLTYQVTTDAPALVTASITNGILSLAAPAGTAGQTTIRLTTTDLEGGTLSSSFSVTVLSSNPLVAWRQTNFGTTADTGSAADLADPDSDGISNLLEYALDLAPLTPSTSGLPALATSAGQLTLTYKRARNDITYVVQTTTNLASPNDWTTTGVAQGTPNADGTTTASIPTSNTTRFLRLQVTRTPQPTPPATA